MKVLAVTDRKQSIRPILEQIELIVSAGADIIVLREKDLSPEEYSVLALQVKDICERHGTAFCVNTFTDIASELGVEYVWIPYGDLVGNGRPSIPNVGVSVHSFEEAIDAFSRGADFLIYGNVFETTCKPGKEARGFEELTRIIRNVDVPVFAIGGITVENMEPVHKTGADGVCLMSAFMRSEDPALIVNRARELR